jgi:hypothetical protein
MEEEDEDMDRVGAAACVTSYYSSSPTHLTSNDPARYTSGSPCRRRTSPTPTIYTSPHHTSIYNLEAKQFDLEIERRSRRLYFFATGNHADFLHVQDATPVRGRGTNSSSRPHHRRQRTVTPGPGHPTVAPVSTQLSSNHN